MKTRTLFSLAISTVILLAGCEYDNFTEPDSELNGQIVYNGNPVGVKSDEIELELWQDGFELSQDIPVYVMQDGSFAATLFDGEYQLVLRQGNGPWVDDTDSIAVQLEGSANVEVPVEPYYIINNESINAAGGDIEASFSVQQVNSNRDLEYVGLYLGTANIVDQIYNEANTTLAGDQITFGDSINLSISLADNDLEGRQNVFARVGLKIAGRSELLFSQVYNIEL
ncbi:MAG: DUF3823 domain-containing protein [Balneolaceae bacterium]|nr:DUF3823 domain-containing protein [Balneolaceae bacterium]